MRRAEKPGLPPLDWERVAQVSAEQASKPLAVLDRAGTLRLVNSAFERFSGWTRHEAVGEGFVELLVPEREVEATSRWLEDAFRGSARERTLLLRTREGRKFRADFELSLVCENGGGALVATLLGAEAVSDAPHPAVEESRYEISTRRNEFGRLLWCTGDPAEEGALCYEVFHGVDAPCNDCPVDAIEVGADVVVRRAARGDTFEIVHASRARDGVAHVHVLRLSEEVFSAMAQAKLEFLAADASLSAREMGVLRYLAMDRSVADIAMILGITPRTVKFHQANIVEKLGLDSRADLIRLIF